MTAVLVGNKPVPPRHSLQGGSLYSSSRATSLTRPGEGLQSQPTPFAY